MFFVRNTEKLQTSGNISSMFQNLMDEDTMQHVRTKVGQDKASFSVMDRDDVRRDQMAIGGFGKQGDFWGSGEKDCFYRLISHNSVKKEIVQIL